ncbi:MAG: diadenylate cyclase CdaA [Candidatus Andersenbacteria bacterium]
MAATASLATQLDAAREQVQLFIQSLNLHDHPFAIVDIVVVAFILYWGWRAIRGTKAQSIVAGLVVVGVIFVVGRTFNLEALNWLLRVTIPALLLAIPVVFQPELRRALERLGRNQPWRLKLSTSRRRAAAIANEVTDAVRTLAQSKTGALIVLARRTGLDEDIERGTRLDAELTSSLLLNIFFPNSPLHDGAVIIRGDRVAAASVTLPLSESVQAYQLGTRHKAALGISEASDALAIVVSEERGTVAVAYNGHLVRNVASERLSATLQATAYNGPSRDVELALGIRDQHTDPRTRGADAPSGGARA